ncbi:MAG TPA: hypothetical protein ENI16_00840 [Candidatus Portnoybacteria bacterium]|nr:hypothetical protein [Candidatus Portnoybacteria bacterium]
MSNLNIEELTKEQFKSPETLGKIQELTEPIFLHLDTKEAYFLAEKIKNKLEVFPELEEVNPTLWKNYQDLVIQLQLVAFPMQSNEECAKLIQENFLEAFKAEVDMENQIIAKFFSTPIVPRSDLRESFQAAIKNNQQKIGLRSVGDWLVDYDTVFDFKTRGDISPSEYISQSQEAQALPEEDKNKLRKIFHIYDTLLIVTPVVTEPIITTGEKLPAKPGKPEEAKPDLPAAPSSEPAPPEPEKVLPSPPPAPIAEEPSPEEKPAPITEPTPAAEPTPTPPEEKLPTPPSPDPSEERPPTPPRPLKEDIYQEKIEEEEKELPRPDRPSPPAKPFKPSETVPKLEGNVVDLKSKK